MENKSSINAEKYAITPISDYASSYENYNSLSFSSAFVISLALCLILLGSIIGNCLVIIAIRKDSSLQTPANYLICSLAFTDLMVAFLVMPFSAIYQILGNWIFGDVFCQIWSATDIACCTASILHLCAIALERHQLVTNAVRYFAVSKTHAVAPKIAVVWVLAVCISIPPVLGWRNSSAIAKNLEKSTINLSAPRLCEVGHEPGYTVFATLGSFYIPLFLLLFLYGRIYRNIHSYVKRSESRTMLSSVYSDETVSVEKRKSSILSFLKKSHSKGSIISRKNSQAPHKSPPDRKLNEEYSPPTKLSQTKHEFAITQENSNNGTVQDSTNTAHTSMPQHRETTSPKEYRRKVYSHPSASSPTARARYKRSNFMRRQMAIDNSSEDNFSKQRKTFPTLLLTHPDIPMTSREFFDSSERSKRRYSEGDIQIFQQTSSEKLAPVPVRTRAHTAGARVHFIVEPKYSKPQQSSGLAKVESHPEDQASYSLMAQHNRRKSQFVRGDLSLLGRKQTVSSHHSKRCFRCCPFALRQNYAAVNNQPLQEDNSPFVRRSLSMRTKIKALKAREIRAIKTLGTIVGAFVVCWLPFFIVTIVKPFCTCYISKDVEAVVLWLGYCNSLMNPIIYTACNREFQTAFKRLLYPLCKCLARERSLSYV